MSGQPAVLVVVRHGARLDSADKEWSTTAAKAYDPPLTYGGWIQCQTLGSRIASELHNLDTATRSCSEDEVTKAERPKKKRKVVIHSSPYLRCLQTSIAVTAGLQSYQPPARPPTRGNRSSLSQPPLTQVSSRDSVPEGIDGDATTITARSMAPPPTPLPLKASSNGMDLKIDAFLGEWLSPSYYENTQHPPSSAELVASAKEFLKTPAETITGVENLNPPITESTSVDWEDKEIEPGSLPIQEKTGLRAAAARGYAMPKRPRTISFGADVSNAPQRTTRPRKGTQSGQSGYSPPVPTYSIAPQDKIPVGFVAHARDACVNVDFGWDSQNPPLDWGDGGPYDEEWGGMHRRFASGLRKMLEFYQGDTLDTPVGKDDEELVVVLVTHQAGCNALIRILTGAPALHDVGLSSLTLATRKPGLRRTTSATSRSPNRRRGSLDLGIADEFDMKIIASTEHLRKSSNPLGLNSPRLGMSPALASRKMVGADSPEGFSIGDPMTWRSTSATFTRTLSQRSHAAEEMSDSAPVQGLWRRGSTYSRDEDADSGEPGRKSSTTTLGSVQENFWANQCDDDNDNEDEEDEEDHDDDAKEHDEKRSRKTDLPVRTLSQKGLWGDRDGSTSSTPNRRRWTGTT